MNRNSRENLHSRIASSTQSTGIYLSPRAPQFPSLCFRYILVNTVFLQEVAESLQKAGVKYAVAGGYAVALHGAVRGTVDIDLVIAFNEQNYVDAEKALSSIGLQAKLPVGAREVFRFREEYIANRNLRAWSFYDPKDPTRLVDIIITYKKRRLSTVKVVYQDTNIALLSKDELIEMKKQSGRPQDLEDIKALRKLL